VICANNAGKGLTLCHFGWCGEKQRDLDGVSESIVGRSDDAGWGVGMIRQMPCAAGARHGWAWGGGDGAGEGWGRRVRRLADGGRAFRVKLCCPSAMGLYGAPAQVTGPCGRRASLRDGIVGAQSRAFLRPVGRLAADAGGGRAFAMEAGATQSRACLGRPV